MKTIQVKIYFIHTRFFKYQTRRIIRHWRFSLWYSENQIQTTNNRNSILFSFVNLQLEVNNSKSAMADQTNGVTLSENQRIRKEETLYDVLHRSVTMILPDASSTESAPLLQRIKISVTENGPRLGKASRNTGQTLLQWTRRGSPLRALLVISVMLSPCFKFDKIIISPFLVSVFGF